MDNIVAATLVGNLSEKVWSQAQYLKRDENLITMVIRLSKTEDDVVDLGSIGGAVAEKFYDEGPKIESEISWKDWITKEVSEIENSGVVVDIVIGHSGSERLWIFGKGRTSAMLLRNNKLAILRPSEGWGDGVAGVLTNNDKVFLGTDEAIAMCHTLKMDIFAGSAKEIVEGIAPFLQKQSDPASCAMTVIEVEQDKQTELLSNESEKVIEMPKIVVNRDSNRARRINAKIGLGLGLVLIFLVAAGLIVRANRTAKAAYLESTGRAKAMIVEAEEVAGTNPERAKILISQSKETLATYLQSKPRKKYGEDAEDLVKEVELKSSEILRVSGISLSSTIEISILDSALKAKRLTHDGVGNMFFVSDQNQFVSVNVSDLSKNTLKIENNLTPNPFTVSKDRFFGVTSDGVWSYDKNEQRNVITRDDNWGEIALIASFGNNIYLLDRGEGEIWKYAATDMGYGDRKRWFGAGIMLDLSKVVDWEVDGDIWLLTASGKLEKYSRGVPAKFALSGFPSEQQNGLFLDPVAVTVTKDKIFVLEKGAKRVVAFTIDGKYLKQYVSEDFGVANDLAVYAEKGYVLVNNVIKEWEL
ncbi:MAG: hypothetical protein E6R05_02410 [Candidatus Moraniibacteriota bacterium]|nr:MAG: hypothetical protein E6R05_02410 [Candidatus Moranbacteria bacterium]